MDDPAPDADPSPDPDFAFELPDRDVTFVVELAADPPASDPAASLVLEYDSSVDCRSVEPPDPDRPDPPPPVREPLDDPDVAFDPETPDATPELTP